MKKQTLLVLAYALVIAGLVLSIKLAQSRDARSALGQRTTFADCGDPPPTDNPSE